jgi:adenylate cyclase
VKEIIAQNGYVDKFIGDAVLAIFRNAFHLDRASIWGEMICGNIGSASLRRLDYTVIGDVVKSFLNRTEFFRRPAYSAT